MGMLPTFVSFADAYGGSGGGVSPIVWLLYIVFIVLFVAAYWRIFTKAGQPGWAAIIPIYNIIVWLRIIGRPWWWIFLLFIPIVNIVIEIMMIHELSKSYGHGVGFTLGLIFLSPIFILILAFGGSRYIGPAGMGGAPLGAPRTV